MPHENNMQSIKELTFSTFELTVQTLQLKYKNNTLKFDPYYQRRYIWDEKKASELIESCILGIPIPNFYIYKNKDSVYEIIDGVQRMNSLLKFMGDEEQLQGIDKPFPLKGLQILTELNGKSYNQLDLVTKSKVYDYAIRCIVLNTQNDDRAIREIFRRLNAGGVKLEDQEIRHAQYTGNGNFTTLLDTLGSHVKEFLPKSSSGTIQKSEYNEETGEYEERTDLIDRKYDEELVLRYFALSYDNNIEDYKETKLTLFLDKIMKKYEYETSSKILEMENDFLDTFSKCKAVFGELTFKGASKTNKRTGISYYDIQMSGLRDIGWDVIDNKKANILLNYEKMCKDPNFIQTLQGGTAQKKSILSRRELWNKFIISDIKLLANDKIS